MPNESNQIDFYVPLTLREMIDKLYYEKINQNLVLDKIISDPEFLNNPLEHIALYSDHGIVHVRNVTKLFLEIINKVHGVLIPKRDQIRLEFMKGYGCVLAYIHDIGMINTTSFGRSTHAEYLPHAVYTPEFEPILDVIWKYNIGGIPWKIMNLSLENEILIPPKLMLRELLTFAYCHSKTAVPIDDINDRVALRKRMQYCLAHTLSELYWNKKIVQLKNVSKNNTNKKQLSEALDLYAKLEDKEENHHQREKILSSYYADFFVESYAWLVTESPRLSELIEDVVDTIRLLRSSDAFRQRGTALKTSANYQIFVDQITANAVYALTNEKDMLFLLEISKPQSAAEANLEGLNLTADGDLIFAFSRGAFATAEATERAINNMAALVEDIQADVIGSFYKPPELAKPEEEYLKKNQKIYILLETTDDKPSFTSRLIKKLIKNNPSLEPLLKVVPSVRKVSAIEGQRYLSAKTVVWDAAYQQQILSHIAKTGHKVNVISVDHAFDYVKVAKLEKGETLVSAGDYAGFVYVAMGVGLAGIPIGGYDRFELPPWMPLGNVGVIRGDVRNATIFAEEAVEVMIIPKEIYLKYWHTTYKISETYEMAARLNAWKLGDRN